MTVTTEKNTMNVRFGKIDGLEDKLQVNAQCRLEVFFRERNDNRVSYWIEEGTITTPVLEVLSEYDEFKVFRTHNTTYVVVDEHCKGYRKTHYGLVDTIPVAGEKITILELIIDYDINEVVETEITATRVGDAYEDSGAFVIYDENDVYLLYKRGKM